MGRQPQHGLIFLFRGPG